MEPSTLCLEPIRRPKAACPATRPVAPMSLPDSMARFGFIDNLRGLAAIWVVLIHLVPWKSDVAQSVALGPICWLLAWPAEYGRQGVTIFFVISGFVIARSLRGAWITPRFFGNFVLRRSIRLDPPYWVSIALMLAVQAGLAMLGGGWVASSAQFPTVAEIGAHLIYGQGILGYGHTCIVYWTLCLEVQFYLLFVLLLGVSQQGFGRSADNSSVPIAAVWLVFLPIALACLLLTSDYSIIATWFVADFQMFLLGALAAWSITDLRCRLPFWILAAGFAALTVGRDWDITLAVATATGVGIYWLALRPQLASRLECRPLAYLGAISYSLYLVHMPIGLSVRAIVIAASPPLLRWGRILGPCWPPRSQPALLRSPHHVSSGRSGKRSALKRVGLKRPRRRRSSRCPVAANKLCLQRSWRPEIDRRNRSTAEPMDASLRGAANGGSQCFVPYQLIVEFGDPAMVGDGVEMLLRSQSCGATHSHPQERLVDQAGRLASIFVALFGRTRNLRLGRDDFADALGGTGDDGPAGSLCLDQCTRQTFGE